MDANQKLRRFLDADEIHGDARELCSLLRDELLKRDLTLAEADILQQTAIVWNWLLRLEEPELSQSALREAMSAIHTIQGIIATRVAGRSNPNVWRND